jgi:Tol biopolymer transport system component
MADTRSLEAALDRVARVSLRRFSEDWSTAVRRRFLPSLADHELTREFATPIVTRESEKASMLLVPSLSPDGRWLAYVSDAGLTRDLYVRDLENGETHRLVRGGQSGEFESLRFFSASSAWSPDGRTLAFVAQARGEDALYLLDVNEGRVRSKHRFGLDELQTPTFSPDGQEILFVGIAEGQSDLYRVRRDGTNLTRLTRDRFAERDPQWSPDGRHVVFVTDRGEETDFEALRFGPWRLALLDLLGGGQKDITPFSQGNAVSPVWSGDGKAIAFIADQDGTPNIYVQFLETSTVLRLTDSVSGIGGILPTSPALSWARESDRLVFSAFSSGGWDLYRIDRPIRELRPLPLEPETPRLALASAAEAASDRANWSEGTAAPLQAGDAPAPPLQGLILPQSEEEGFKERRYKARLAPDLSYVGGVVGTYGGLGGASLIHFSDLLGEHLLTLGFGIYGSLKDSDLSLDYVNRTGRINYRLGAFQHQRRYGFVMDRGASVERQTYLGVRTAAIRPFDKFSRLEASLQVAGVRGRFFLGETAIDSEGDQSLQEIRTFVGPGLAYVVDTAIYGVTGPILGRRLRLSLEAGIGELDFRTFEADLRQYWSFGRRFTVAARGYLATSWGATPQSFYLGGPHTLRGYGYGTLTGYHAGLAALEFRFPLLRYVALGWPLPLEMANIGGVLFAETATAFDGELLRTSRAVVGRLPGLGPQVAYGFGTRLNLGAYVLRIDWAQRYDPQTGRTTPGTSIAVGTDF